MEELQLFSVFGKQLYKPRATDSFELSTKAESIVIEIERSEKQRTGRKQLREYLSSTSGLFDEGYLSGYSLEPVGGTIALAKGGKLEFLPPEEPIDTRFSSDRFEQLRRQELENVKGNLQVQLFKNLPLKDIISVSEVSGGIETFQQLLDSMLAVDPGYLKDAIKDRTFRR